MRARHRLSKLLLRQGFVYSGGKAWTARHDLWLRQIGRTGIASRATQTTFESDYETVLAVNARRDRLDAAIRVIAADSEFTLVVARLGCLRGVSTLTGFVSGRDRRLGPVHRCHHRLVRGADPERVLLGSLAGPGLDHQDRQKPRAPAVGRGRLAPPTPLSRREDHARPVGAGPTGRTRPRRSGQPPTARQVGVVQRPQEEARDRRRGRCPRARRLVLVAGCHGRLTP
jgi:hypothetical protein